jgi:hypothetical protein
VAILPKRCRPQVLLELFPSGEQPQPVFERELVELGGQCRISLLNLDPIGRFAVFDLHQVATGFILYDFLAGGRQCRKGRYPDMATA